MVDFRLSEPAPTNRAGFHTECMGGGTSILANAGPIDSARPARHSFYPVESGNEHPHRPYAHSQLPAVLKWLPKRVQWRIMETPHYGVTSIQGAPPVRVVFRPEHHGPRQILISYSSLRKIHSRG